MKVIVTGGRDYTDEAHVFEVLDKLHAQRPITLLVEGAAPGADTLAYKWAVSRGVASKRFRVTKEEWQQFGKAAGPKRNRRMFNETNPDQVVAFPGGVGTEDMCSVAKKAGLIPKRV